MKSSKTATSLVSRAQNRLTDPCLRLEDARFLAELLRIEKGRRSHQQDCGAAQQGVLCHSSLSDLLRDCIASPLRRKREESAGRSRKSDRASRRGGNQYPDGCRTLFHRVPASGPPWIKTVLTVCKSRSAVQRWGRSKALAGSGKRRSQQQRS